MGLSLPCFGMSTTPLTSMRAIGSHNAALEIESLRLLDGKLPPRALGLVIEWAFQHREELMANWEKARNQTALKKIDPLP